MMKKIAASVLYVLYRILDPFFRFQDVSVLAYHSISDASIDTAVSPTEFEKQLAYVQAKGHSFVALSVVVDWYVEGKTLPRKAVAITFDDGYADFESNALPILSKFSAPATVFVMGDADASRPQLGNNIPLLSSDSVERLRAHPLVEVASHGKSHANLRFLSGGVLKEEMYRQRERFFAFPGGSYSPAAVRLAEELGYDAAFSIKPGLITKKSNRFLMQRNVILRGMSVRDVAKRTTRAHEWYARLSRWFK
jgi:peptidoglycan/xylan/chitin deacetylase (PgdA/CDA1 family)